MELIIDSTRIKSVGSSIKQQASAFENLYNEIKNGMRNLANNWKGSSAEAFYKQFNQLSASFEAYKLVLNEYGEFLINSAGEFATAEHRIGNEAGSLGSDRIFK
jgi:WXG100 family type VII secretion target